MELPVVAAQEHARSKKPQRCAVQLPTCAMLLKRARGVEGIAHKIASKLGTLWQPPRTSRLFSRADRDLSVRPFVSGQRATCRSFRRVNYIRERVCPMTALSSKEP